MQKVSFLIIIIIVLSDFAFSQSGRVASYTPKFKSLQLDATSAIFTNTLGGCIDVDIIADSYAGSIGIRLGADFYQKGEVGGPIHGSPFTDINLFARATADHKVFRADLCIGGTIHKVSERYYEDANGLYPKFSLDLKIKFFRNYAGAIARINLSKESYGGIGLFIGYGN